MASSAVRITLAEQVAAALRAAGHEQAVATGVGGFFAVECDGSVIVVADPGQHAEEYFRSAACREAKALAVASYAEALEAAGLVAQVHRSGTGLVVTGRQQ
jgi:hypothetical protein